MKIWFFKMYIAETGLDELDEHVLRGYGLTDAVVKKDDQGNYYLDVARKMAYFHDAVLSVRQELQEATYTPTKLVRQDGWELELQ